MSVQFSSLISAFPHFLFNGYYPQSTQLHFTFSLGSVLYENKLAYGSVKLEERTVNFSLKFCVSV